jgi:hypothetical protein
MKLTDEELDLILSGEASEELQDRLDELLRDPSSDEYRHFAFCAKLGDDNFLMRTMGKRLPSTKEQS